MTNYKTNIKAKYSLSQYFGMMVRSTRLEGMGVDNGVEKGYVYEYLGVDNSKRG